MSFSGHAPALYMNINRIGPIRWMPLALAVGVHFLTFILLLFPPSFFIPDRNIPEIQTINLFTVEEFEQKTQAPPPPVVAEPPREEAPPPQENVQSIATETLPPSQSTPAEVISLHPRRVKKKIVQEAKPKPPVKQDIKRQNAIERIQARVNQKEEEQQLKHNLARLRDSLHSSVKESPKESQTEDTNQQQTQPAAPSSQGTSARINAAERSYFIAVQRRILDNWALPKTQDWDSNLEALVIIYISKTGVISKTVFEKKSKNVYFNQYVEKTIQAAAPMPPIPSALKKNTLEIGLRFKPSGLF